MTCVRSASSDCDRAENNHLITTKKPRTSRGFFVQRDLISGDAPVC